VGQDRGRRGAPGVGGRADRVSRVGGYAVAQTPVICDTIPAMRKVGVFLALTALAACESQSPSSQDVATVRAAGDAMEESGSFAVEMTIDLRDAGTPHIRRVNDQRTGRLVQRKIDV
jgi:hypothetical protein